MTYVELAELTEDELESLRNAKTANKWYFMSVIEACGIMRQRREKYSGDSDPYTNFYIVKTLINFLIHKISMDIVFMFYLALKFARLLVSVGDDFDDESSDDTLTDLANYAHLFRGERIKRKQKG